jgi:hypothetical protein
MEPFVLVALVVATFLLAGAIEQGFDVEAYTWNATASHR